MLMNQKCLSSLRNMNKRCMLLGLGFTLVIANCQAVSTFALVTRIVYRLWPYLYLQDKWQKNYTTPFGFLGPTIQLIPYSCFFLWFHTWGLYIDFYCTMSPHHVGTTIFLTSLRRFFVCPKTLNPNR